MDVKEAATKAKQYVIELFESEGIINVGLEEARFDKGSNRWKITIGFSRPWDHRNPLTAAFEDPRNRRSFKVVQINDYNGEVESLMDRVMATSE